MDWNGVNGRYAPGDSNSMPGILADDGFGYVLEDVPHLTDYLPGLQVTFSLLSVWYLRKKRKRKFVTMS